MEMGQNGILVCLLRTHLLEPVPTLNQENHQKVAKLSELKRILKGQGFVWI